jgi:hypothetical protein
MLSKRLPSAGVIRRLALWAAAAQRKGKRSVAAGGVQLVDILLHQGLLVERQ